jgi:hypothetical protein
VLVIAVVLSFMLKEVPLRMQSGMQAAARERAMIEDQTMSSDGVLTGTGGATHTPGPAGGEEITPAPAGRAPKSP